MLKKIPDTYLIIFSLIVISAALTWVVPGGKYHNDINTENGQSTIRFHHTEHQEQTWQIFTAFQKGFQRQASIIIFVLIVGGVFWILNETKAIDQAILSLVKRMKSWENGGKISTKASSLIILTLIMLVFSVFGAVFGMSEETIAFIAILIPLSISLGYDSITGVAIVFVAAGLGFAGAVLNPFTIGIAQGIAELPLFSGIEYRLFCWLIINCLGFAFILRYASKIRNKPELSPVYEMDSYWRDRSESITEAKEKPSKFTWIIFVVLVVIQALFALWHHSSEISIGNNEPVHIPAIPFLCSLFAITSLIILKKGRLYLFHINLLAFTILYLLVGVLSYSWYIDEISALFLAMGISVSVASGNSGKKLVSLFQEGTRDILGAALIIGLAGGIIVILENGQIIDTILHFAAGLMQGNAKSTNIGIMYLTQNFLNIIIPSGSAKAAITMPIMAPFSDLIGISRQATVLAFQFGDGFTNLITPASGVLMAVIGIAKIPFAIWFKWIAPLVGLLIILGFLLLIPTVTISLNGF